MSCFVGHPVCFAPKILYFYGLFERFSKEFKKFRVARNYEYRKKTIKI